jgi:hypothetical protein
MISKILRENAGIAIDMKEYIIKLVYNAVMVLAFGKK